MQTLEEVIAELESLKSQFADFGARLGGVEQKPVVEPEVTTSNNDWNWFPVPVDLIDRSITSSDSDFIDSKSSTYVPATAKELKLFCYVDGTADGTGLNKIEVRGGGTQMIILAANEEGSGSAPAPCCQPDLPVSSGRFDYKATRSGGSGSFSFVMQIVAWR